MVSQSLPSMAPAPSQILHQAAHTVSARPTPPQVTVALLDAERLAKKQHLELAVDALLGTWQLRFTAPKKPAYKAGEPEGKGFYWPTWAPGTISFHRTEPASDQLAIENQVQFGPLTLRFNGPAKFLPKKNLLAFDFVQIQLFIGGLRLLKIPIQGKAGAEDFATLTIGKLPFFAFFAATEDYIAARGRGGGLALWGNPKV